MELNNALRDMGYTFRRLFCPSTLSHQTLRADTLIALPRIVVIGGQSSASMIHARYLYFLTFSSAGKSSLVEAVTGVSRAFCNVSSPPSSQIEDSRSKG